MPKFKILTAGIPCQPFSIAGSRQGFADTRGTAFFDIAQVCDAKKPQHIVLENVKGLLSHDNGRTFSTIIGILTDIGYSVEWQVLNSKHFGVPQNRERIYIVGHLGKESRQKIFPIIRETENLHIQQEQDTEEAYNIAQTLKTKDYVCWNGNYVICGNTNPSGRGMNGKIYDASGLAPAITTNKGEGSKIHDGIQLRKLTPLECFRLQGFPDEIVYKAYEIGISDRQLYKMAGNAVTVPVVYEIAKRLMELCN